MDDLLAALKLFVETPSYVNTVIRILDTELSFPNVPTPTMGGEIFWINLAEYKGWRIQQNMFTHHARILDNNNLRIAWGTVNGMQKALNRLVDSTRCYQEDPIVASNNRERVIRELENLSHLRDIKAITPTEYDEKKKYLLTQF